MISTILISHDFITDTIFIGDTIHFYLEPVWIKGEGGVVKGVV